MSRNRDVMPINAERLSLDTWGMSTEQVGAYFLILMDLWANGPIKYDDEQLARVARVPLARWLKISPYILRFLQLEDGHVNFEYGRHIGVAKRQPIPLRLRTEIIERDGFVCAYCGTTEGAFEIDHIFPVAKGGNNEMENLCVACANCNRSKRDTLVSEWRQ